MIVKIDIEESAKYAEYGIIAFTDGTYYKPRKLSDSEKKEHIVDAEYELVPLTFEEKKQYGIIEESEKEKVVNDDGFDIEESATEPTEEEKKKKQSVTITGSPESVKAAREMLEKEIQRRNLGEQSETDDLPSLKLKMYEKFNKNGMFLDANSKEQLSAMVENYVNTAIEKGKGTPSGTARCDTPQQMGVKDDLFTHKFSSWGELIDTLQEKAKTSNEAKSYLDEYWRMAVQAMKTNQTPMPIPSRNSVENMPPLKDEHGYKVLVNPERDSDIQALQRKWREERLRRMEVKKEEGNQQ